MGWIEEQNHGIDMQLQETRLITSSNFTNEASKHGTLRQCSGECNIKHL